MRPAVHIDSRIVAPAACLVARGRIAFARSALVAAAVLALLAAAPGAQSPALNGKQRLLAGERLDPAILLAELADRRAEARMRSQATPAGSTYVPGLIVAKFADDAEPARLSALAAQAGARRVVPARSGAFSVLHVDPASDVVAVARHLAAQPGVVYAEPAARLRKAFRPNDPLYEYQWNLQKLDMERAWNLNRGADSGLVVAIVDTGIAYLTEGELQQAPDLAGTTFVAGYDFIWDDDMPVDLDGHGTHVTGTIAQTTNNNEGVAGIAYNVSVMPLKALDGEIDALLGAPNIGTTATLADAIRHAADHGAKVINVSLGADGGSTALREALTHAVDQGAVVVAAAGNNGDVDSAPFYPAAYAAEIEGVIAVAALDFNLERSYFSNVNDYVELAAPGGDVRVDLNDDGFGDGVLQQTLDRDAIFNDGRFDVFVYQFDQGTSMASPHVAAVAALLVDQGITDPRAIEAALKRFATDLGPAGRDDETGYGLVNPRATLRGLGLAR